MLFLQILQTVLLIILVDRNLIIRDRYKLAFERNINEYDKYRHYFAVWIYCNGSRSGGRRLFYFKYGKNKTTKYANNININ